MLSRRHRINRDAFEVIFRKGKAYHSSNFSLRIMKTNKTPGYAAAFVISKKVEKKAVARNRAKRRCYYALHSISPTLRGSFLAVFIIKKPVRTLSTNDIRNEIISLLLLAGVAVS